MPKRAPHGRPAKSKNRARRPAAARPVDNGAGTAVESAQAFPGAVSAAPVATSAASAPARTAAARRSSAVKRSPGIIINYDYLRHDFRTLAIIAPSMIVLLVLAYFFLH